MVLPFFFFKQKTAYEMRISDWSSDVCSSDLPPSEPPSAAPSTGDMVEPPLPTWTKKVPVSLLPSASFTVYWMASLPCQPALGLNRMVPSLANERLPPAALSEATAVPLSGPSPPLSFQGRWRAFSTEERRVGK